MRSLVFLLPLIMLLLLLPMASAHEADFNATKQLIDSGVSCDELTDEQREEIGEYYMEQMHPGEAHELMDKMMGGENSESLKQMHINMAKRIYCDEDVAGMDMMSMMMGGGMMGMMGNGAPSSMGYSNLQRNTNIALVLSVIALIVAGAGFILSYKRKGGEK